MKLGFVDDFLGFCTMYRLVLYFLIWLLLNAIILGYFNVLPFDPTNIIFSAALLTIVCWIANSLFAKIFKVSTNLESFLISALILTLVITPSYQMAVFLVLAAVLAMASKYILTIARQHLFNPVAFTLALLAIIFNQPASWWVGNWWMVAQVAAGGLLIVRKIRKFNLVFSFFITTLVMISGFSVLQKNSPLTEVQKTILNTPLIFFAFVMLTEPQTTPASKILQIIYGSLVGLLFALPIQIGSFYLTPELALLVGNSFSYLVSPKQKLLLKLKEKKQIAPDIYDFVFNVDKKLSFLPGQYMEWALPHPNPDSRGIRRYFTIASSPTEANLRIGIKFYPNSSSFKKSLVSLPTGGKLVASQLAGDFTLPQDRRQKLCFMAGGIGITPFVSMIKYLLDTNQKRDIILLFSNKTAADIVYKDIFDSSFKLGIKTVYFLTDKVGYINAKIIQKEVPDYHNRIFYISGPPTMVNAFAKLLKEIAVSQNQIKLDFFSGYA